jgi:hypothetical protein
MMPEADKYAQSFLDKKIESIVINEYETSNKKYDILYSTILYPDSGEDSFELINTMKDSLKKAMEV